MFSLLERFPNSEFLNYCVTQVCLRHPENVCDVPPYVLNLNAFQNIIRFLIENSDQNHINRSENIHGNSIYSQSRCTNLFYPR